MGERARGEGKRPRLLQLQTQPPHLNPLPRRWSRRVRGSCAISPSSNQIPLSRAARRSLPLSPIAQQWWERARGAGATPKAAATSNAAPLPRRWSCRGRGSCACNRSAHLRLLLYYNTLFRSPNEGPSVLNRSLLSVAMAAFFSTAPLAATAAPDTDDDAPTLHAVDVTAALDRARNQLSDR